MRFGADLNAYTSFDETVYMLTVPTDDPALLATGSEFSPNGRPGSASRARRSTGSAGW